MAVSPNRSDAGESVAYPVCVDLDGTLLITDSLLESLLRLIKNRPLAMLSIPRWLVRGKAFFKQRVADHVDLDRVHVGPNCGLEYLPHPQAEAKMKRLAEAVKTYKSPRRA